MLLIPDVVVRFMGFICNVYIGAYANVKQVALVLRSKRDGSPVAKVTVAAPGVQITWPTFLVKSWNENEGMVEALEAAQLAHRTGVTVPMGFTEAHEMLASNILLDAIDNIDVGSMSSLEQLGVIRTEEDMLYSECDATEADLY